MCTLYTGAPVLGVGVHEAVQRAQEALRHNDLQLRVRRQQPQQLLQPRQRVGL
jgi:hypothetical protein